MQSHISAHYPGTSLAMLEWFFYRSGDIQGAIAAADTLGIFGKYGVYAASMWGNASVWAYRQPNCNDEKCVSEHAYVCVKAAWNAFRNFNGAGAQFGNTYVSTTVTDPKRTPSDERITAYASIDQGQSNRMVIMIINKSQTTAISTRFPVSHPTEFHSATPFTITGSNGGAGGCTSPTKGQPLGVSNNTFEATLAPQTITIFELKP
jgi:hypothetical protein